MVFVSTFTRSRTVRAGALDVNVADAGSATGPAVLLLHGNPDTHTVWSPVVAELAAKHHCIAPDMPGFGGTPAPAALTFALAEQGAFVRDLVDALGLARVHLVVHDVGGTYGNAFATLHPERVASLTIINTVFFPDYRWHFWARVWRTRGLGELAMALSKRPLLRRELLRGSPRMPRDYADHAYEALTPASKAAVLRWYRAMDPEVWIGWDARFLAATAHTPKVTLWGDLDPFLQARFAERFGGDVQHVGNAGHWVMLEEPLLTASVIAANVAAGHRA